MQIDITAAAKEYGLPEDRIPPVIIEDAGDDKSGSPAWFDGQDGAIHVWADTPELGDDYTRSRIARMMDNTVLDNEDELRFIIAHELYHAVQSATPAGVFTNQVETFLYTTGILEHDLSPGEVAADAAASTVFHLIEIDGRKGASDPEPTMEDAMENFSIYEQHDRIMSLLHSMPAELRDAVMDAVPSSWDMETPYAVTYRTRGDGQRTTLMYANDASDARTRLYLYLHARPSDVDVLSIHAER